MGNTANFNLEYPEGSDDVNIAQHIQNLAEDVDTQLSNISQTLDTGWRIFPGETFDAVHTGCTATQTIQIVQRRIGHIIYTGGVYTLLARTGVATAGFPTRLLAVPTGFMKPSAGFYSSYTGTAQLPWSNASGNSGVTFAFARTVNGQMYMNINLSWQLHSATSAIELDTPYFFTSVGSQVVTDDPWPDPLPGVAWTP